MLGRHRRTASSMETLEVAAECRAHLILVALLLHAPTFRGVSGTPARARLVPAGDLENPERDGRGTVE